QLRPPYTVRQLATEKSAVDEPGWTDDASQPLSASQKKGVQLPGRAPLGVRSFQCVPPSDVRRMRLVPEPAAQPVLMLTMVNVVGAISGYGPTLGSGVGLAGGVAGGDTEAVAVTIGVGRGLTFRAAFDCRSLVTPTPSPIASTSTAAAAISWNAHE